MESTIAEINLIGLNKEVNIELPVDEETIPLLLKLRTAFTTNCKILEGNIIRINEKSHNEEIETLLEPYLSKYPILNRITSFHRKLKLNEVYTILAKNDITLLSFQKLYNYLFSVNRSEDFDKLQKGFTDLFKSTLNEYSYISYDGSKELKLGEPNKELRICTFCSEGDSTVNFTKTAHAISEFLENKCIKNHNECDDCNEYFGNTIEEDLAKYFEIARVLFGISGKNGIPKIKGKNFTFSNDGETTQLKIRGGKLEENDDIKNQILESNGSLILQNVYKALCKYFFSVVENRELIKYYGKTIKWVRGAEFKISLPKIAIGTAYQLMTNHPKIGLYIKKSDNQDLPVSFCELRIKHMIIVFIVPDFNSETNFDNEAIFSNFWNKLDHYKKIENWNFIDLNSSVTSSLKTEFNFGK